MNIRRLTLTDADAYRQIRLAGLHDTPSAFSASPASELALTAQQMQARISGPSASSIWGAWDSAGQLQATMGLQHDNRDKLAHKALVYSVYVAPAARGQGLSARLLDKLIAFAGQQPGLRQLNLGVTAGNAAAIKVYERAGFVQYGLERNAICVDGQFYDEVLMQLELPLQAATASVS